MIGVNKNGDLGADDLRISGLEFRWVITAETALRDSPLNEWTVDPKPPGDLIETLNRP